MATDQDMGGKRGGFNIGSAVARKVGWYAVGQALSFGLDLLLFFILTSLIPGLWAPARNVINKLTVAVFSYVFHDKISFRGEKQHTAGRSILSYGAVLAVNIALSSGMLAVLLPLAHVVTPYLPFALPQALLETGVKFGGDIVVAVITFFLVDRFVFPQKAAAPVEDETFA